MEQAGFLDSGVWRSPLEVTGDRERHYELLKRLMDVIASSAGLILLAPLLLLVGVFIRLGSPGPALFRQQRIGRGCEAFTIYKFRTMLPETHAKGPAVTVGDADPRVTRFGRFLRKYKIDELPQLFNVLLGDMSLVGPRPEVLNYIDLSDPRQRMVFSVRPGLTAPSSLALIDVSEQLAREVDPVRMYNEKILPMKIRMNMQYIRDRSISLDLKLVLVTLVKVVR